MLFLLLLLLPTHLGGKDWDKSKSFLSLSHSPSVLRHLFFVFCSKFNSSVMFLLSCSDLLLSVVRPVLFIFLGFFFSVALFVLFSCCCLVCTTYNYDLAVSSLNQLLSREPQKKETQARANCSAAPTQLALCLRLASIYKAESWQRAVTLGDSTPQ